MIASERRWYILGTLTEKGVISIKETAQELGVTEMTIRRDIEKLSAEGKLKQVRGGAIASEEMNGVELAFSQKLNIQTDEKTTICEYAAGLVEDGSCVFVDAGTTLVPLLNILIRRHVKIITHNMYFLRRPITPVAELVLLGGNFKHIDCLNVGPITVDTLEKFGFDAAFLGCVGLDAQQRIVYSTDVDSYTIKHKALENTKNSYLLADYTKFSKRGFIRFSEFEKFDGIITNKFDCEYPLPDNVIML